MRSQPAQHVNSDRREERRDNRESRENRERHDDRGRRDDRRRDKRDDRYDARNDSRNRGDRERMRDSSSRRTSRNERSSPAPRDAHEPARRQPLRTPDQRTEIKQEAPWRVAELGDSPTLEVETHPPTKRAAATSEEPAKKRPALAATATTPETSYVTSRTGKTQRDAARVEYPPKPPEYSIPLPQHIEKVATKWAKANSTAYESIQIDDLARHLTRQPESCEFLEWKTTAKSESMVCTICEKQVWLSRNDDGQHDSHITTITHLRKLTKHLGSPFSGTEALQKMMEVHRQLMPSCGPTYRDFCTTAGIPTLAGRLALAEEENRKWLENVKTEPTDT